MRCGLSRSMVLGTSEVGGVTSLARALAAVALASVVLACESEAPDPARREPAPTVASAVFSARRPARTFFIANDNGACVLYFSEGDKQSKEQWTRCPRDIAPGERMRLAGRTCLRESDRPERRAPVRCPKSLVVAEREAGPEPSAKPTSSR
jgi:hypothetical protein